MDDKRPGSASPVNDNEWKDVEGWADVAPGAAPQEGSVVLPKLPAAALPDGLNNVPRMPESLVDLVAGQPPAIPPEQKGLYDAMMQIRQRAREAALLQAGGMGAAKLLGRLARPAAAAVDDSGPISLNLQSGRLKVPKAMTGSQREQLESLSDGFKSSIDKIDEQLAKISAAQKAKLPLPAARKAGVPESFYQRELQMNMLKQRRQMLQTRADTIEQALKGVEGSGGAAAQGVDKLKLLKIAAASGALGYPMYHLVRGISSLMGK